MRKCVRIWNLHSNAHRRERTRRSRNSVNSRLRGCRQDVTEMKLAAVGLVTDGDNGTIGRGTKQRQPSSSDRDRFRFRDNAKSPSCNWAVTGDQ